MFTSRSRALAELDPLLREIAGKAKRVGIFTDFDGSLSLIVPDPERARAVRGATRALSALARRYAVVAVISGRPVRFLARRLHPRGVRMIGLYGIEERVGRTLNVLTEVNATRSGVERAIVRLQDALGDWEGVHVENKGLSLSVHFRRTPDPDAAFAFAEPTVIAIAEEEGLHLLMRGRKVLEVGPRVSVDKGIVVRRLVADAGLDGAVVVGDDIGDIAMFDAVGSLPLAARVAVESDESPAELIARADLRVPGPQAAVQLLRRLASATSP
ncbi:MAG TPA: trehalose-phosphatase [Actinomycetota bacterium]|nr:trehalose-phosphatase [Actinomycetota bacterium]